METSRPDTKNAQYQVRLFSFVDRVWVWMGWMVGSATHTCIRAGHDWRTNQRRLTSHPTTQTPTYITSHNANANANEQEVIKQGDLLLNRLSKLARIVDF